MDKEMKMAVIQTSFKNMISKGHFNICVVDKACDLLHVQFTSEEYTFMNLLHCIDFADISDDIKSELQEILERGFSKEAFTITVGKKMFGGTKTKLLTFVEKNK